MVVGSEEKTSDADFTAVCGDIAVIMGVVVKEEMELGGGMAVSRSRLRNEMEGISFLPDWSHINGFHP